MTKEQRFRYEMFVRVCDFGVAHAALFPEASRGGQALARVGAAIREVDEHTKNHVLGRAVGRRIKAETRAAVFEYLKMIAAVAQRMARSEPGVSPFLLPTHRSLAGELSTARAFIEAAATRQAEFEQFGLPPTFIGDFQALVEQLQQAVNVRLGSRTLRRKAMAGIRTALAHGLDAICELHIIVSIATRQDPTTFEAWTSARRVRASGPAPSNRWSRPRRRSRSSRRCRRRCRSGHSRRRRKTPGHRTPVRNRGGAPARAPPRNITPLPSPQVNVA